MKVRRAILEKSARWRLLRLQEATAKSAKARGHMIPRFKVVHLPGLVKGKEHWAATAECFNCGAEIIVKDNPGPNEYAISGSALTTHCKRRK